MREDIFSYINDEGGIREDLNMFLEEKKTELLEKFRKHFKKMHEHGTSLGAISVLNFGHKAERLWKSLEGIHRLEAAFRVLSTTTVNSEILRFTKDMNNVPVPKNFDLITEKYDCTNEMENVHFERDVIEKLSCAILEDDHNVFFEILKKIVDNASLARRYTKAVFGKAVRKT